MTSPVSLPSSTRRLLKDLQEIRDAPVSVNVNARPLDADIYQWHGNLRHKAYGITFHFNLLFPSNYPSSPPSILLSTPLPHPNVLQAVGGWKVCLDMLDVEQAKERKEYKGWSQSYSVKSILMQLEAFLLEGEALNNTQVGTVDQAALAAHDFQCEKCSHKVSAPWPAWPTEEDVRRRITHEFKMPEVVLKSSKKVQPSSQKMFSDAGGWQTVTRKKHDKKKVEPAQPRVWKPGHKRSLKKEDSSTCVAELERLQIARPETAVPCRSKVKDEDTEMHDASDGPLIDPAKAGFFSELPYELMLQILLEELSVKDVLNLSLTCRHLRFMCLDSYLWKKFFNQRFGDKTELKVNDAAHYLAAFAQEVNSAAWDLRCYASKVSVEDDVLGVGVDWTVNPKTKRVDYISVIDCSDLLSRSAFLEDQVKTTVWNKTFRGWLPLYISAEHFQRALPDLQAFMIKLASTKQRHFSPGIVLDVIPKMMNTLVVLLMDRGVSLSVNAIEGYFQLHRLLLGFIDEYPELQTRINNRIKKFIDEPNLRTKQHEPSLGDLFPLLAASDKYTWSSKGLNSALLGESFDRRVLWTAKEHPEIVKVQHKHPKVIKADEELLKKWLSAGKVSRRLVAFHVQLLNLLSQHGGGKSNTQSSTRAIDQLRVSSDMLYGRPPRHVTEKFQATVKKVMEMDSWPDFFKSAMVPVPSKEKLTQLLNQSVRNSFGKGYHDSRTDFSHIQKSGVSRILRGGESVKIDIHRVTMKESWRWRGSGTEYLDASCHAFSFSNAHVTDLTYNNALVFYDDKAKSYAMTHSGDVINSALKHGEHTMNINLGLLKDKDIKSLVFCMTAWSSSNLQSFYDPEVSINMPDNSDQQLASYNFGSTRDAGNKKSIIMSVLSRPSAGSDAWSLKAIGHIGWGSLSHMKTLIDECKAVVQTQLD